MKKIVTALLLISTVLVLDGCIFNRKKPATNRAAIEAEEAAVSAKTTEAIIKGTAQAEKHQ